MAFRNPMYLDVPLLKNLADYYDIDVPAPRHVIHRSSGSRDKGVGIETAVVAHVISEKAVETTESYNTDLRPVRLVNDVIDSLLGAEDVIDLTEDAGQALAAQSPIQVEGELIVSPATEIGSLLGRFLPIMIAKYEKGEAEPSLEQADLAELLAAPQAEGSQVYDVNLVDAFERRFVVILDPKNITEGRDCDDLEGEFTVFGIVDRLLSETSSLSLSRYLFPGMNPMPFRRA